MPRLFTHIPEQSINRIASVNLQAILYMHIWKLIPLAFGVNMPRIVLCSWQPPPLQEGDHFIPILQLDTEAESYTAYLTVSPAEVGLESPHT